MPDYTACKGEGCEVKQECARFRMEWGEYRQSVFMNSPGKDKNCEHFWDVKSGVPFRLRSADVSNPKEGWVMTREQLEAERDRLAEEHADRYYEGTIEEMGLEWAKRRSAYEILKQDFSSVFTAALDLLMPEVDKLRAENARLREALEWYAKPMNVFEMVKGGAFKRADDRARQALKGEE